jgi:hypothetical protein
MEDWYYQVKCQGKLIIKKKSYFDFIFKKNSFSKTYWPLMCYSKLNGTGKIPISLNFLDLENVWILRCMPFMNIWQSQQNWL